MLNKARENPEAKQKVRGKTLLELEETNVRCQEKIEQQAKQLHITRIKLAKTEKHILRLANLLSYADNNIEQTSKEKEMLDEQLSELITLQSVIDNSLTKTKKKLEIGDKKLKQYYASNLEMKKTIESLLNEFKQSIVENDEDMKGVINDLAQIISDKENTIIDLKHDMMQITIDKNKETEGAIDHLVEKEIEYNDRINKLDNDLLIKTKQLENTEASINLTFTDKDKQIRKLRTKLGAKMKNIDKLTKNINELEERVLEAHYSEKVLEEIRNLMLTKGFINDKELDKLTKEIKKQNFMIFH